MATATEEKALGYNLQVDYVIHYSFGDVGEWAPHRGWDWRGSRRC